MDLLMSMEVFGSTPPGRRPVPDPPVWFFKRDTDWCACGVRAQTATGRCERCNAAALLIELGIPVAA